MVLSKEMLVSVLFFCIDTRNFGILRFLPCLWRLFNHFSLCIADFSFLRQCSYTGDLGVFEFSLVLEILSVEEIFTIFSFVLETFFLRLFPCNEDFDFIRLFPCTGDFKFEGTIPYKFERKVFVGISFCTRNLEFKRKMPIGIFSCTGKKNYHHSLFDQTYFWP